MPFPFKVGWKEQKLHKKERIIPAAVKSLLPPGDISGASPEGGYILAPPHPNLSPRSCTPDLGLPLKHAVIIHSSLNKNGNNKTICILASWARHLTILLPISATAENSI